MDIDKNGFKLYIFGRVENCERNYLKKKNKCNFRLQNINNTEQLNSPVYLDIHDDTIY